MDNSAGVYLFKNRFGNVLYIGKAKVLKHRIRSYFQPKAKLSDVKKLLVQQVATIDTIPVETETDAIVLEDQLIKDYQPRFNILAKDDKSFLYIHITDETFPRVLAVRRPDLDQGGIFYGPYPYARSLRDVLRLVHTVFQFRTCASLPKKACLEYYIGNCQAPCIGNISQTDYRQQIDQIIAFFEGKNKNIASELEGQMQQAAAQQKFELAARLRNQITALDRLQSLRKTPRQYLLEQLQQSNLDVTTGLDELAGAVHIHQPLHRIEVYDISHHQGKYMVGSMIVFTDGLPDKAEYRRFKIRTVTGQSDDFKSFREVVQRRLKRAWPLPDLAIMDGGKGQLSAVAQLWELAQVPVAALAKKREELFLPDSSIPLTLPAGSQGLFLVQRLRDEAHRFAISYYRWLHTKAMRPE
ncbi:MAG TPA: excinuclease ABC subunit C [Candidatus Kerfeldbacteria bacterium]|nr:excinuclease ABC subunit C [Candidatus Kerfeldbacteria bacterium]